MDGQGWKAKVGRFGREVFAQPGVRAYEVGAMIAAGIALVLTVIGAWAKWDWPVYLGIGAILAALGLWALVGTYLVWDRCRRVIEAAQAEPDPHGDAIDWMLGHEAWDRWKGASDYARVFYRQRGNLEGSGATQIEWARWTAGAEMPDPGGWFGDGGQQYFRAASMLTDLAGRKLVEPVTASGSFHEVPYRISLFGKEVAIRIEADPRFADLFAERAP